MISGRVATICVCLLTLSPRVHGQASTSDRQRNPPRVVIEVQRSLMVLGYGILALDGTVDGKTGEAIRQFQMNEEGGADGAITARLGNQLLKRVEAVDDVKASKAIPLLTRALIAAPPHPDALDSPALAVGVPDISSRLWINVVKLLARGIRENTGAHMVRDLRPLVTANGRALIREAVNVLIPLLAPGAVVACGRVSVADALGDSLDSRAIEPLITSFSDHAICSDGSNESVAANAAFAVGMIADRESGRSGADGRLVSSLVAAPSVLAATVDALTTVLQDTTDKAAQTSAVNALWRIGHKRAVEPLIWALGDSALRHDAVLALGDIGDARAVQPLVALLGQDDISPEAVLSLKEIGKPALPALTAALTTGRDGASDRAAFAAARALVGITDVGTMVLLSGALERKDFAVIAGAIPFFVRQGRYGTEGVLIDALDRFGDKTTAEILLNCGNKQLETAASVWARQRNYGIVKRPASQSTARWRSVGLH